MNQRLFKLVLPQATFTMMCWCCKLKWRMPRWEAKSWSWRWLLIRSTEEGWDESWKWRSPSPPCLRNCLSSNKEGRWLLKMMMLLLYGNLYWNKMIVARKWNIATKKQIAANLCWNYEPYSLQSLPIQL